jgi:Na+-transporting methylmalonyl-CoA/oxaloacetate decarboxylase gamma subunit
MGFAEIFFIFIFILIGLINVIARIIASKRRKEKEAQVQGAVQQEKPSQKQNRREEKKKKHRFKVQSSRKNRLKSKPTGLNSR